MNIFYKKLQNWKNKSVKLATVVEGNPKAPFSKPRFREGRYSFPRKKIQYKQVNLL